MPETGEEYTKELQEIHAQTVEAMMEVFQAAYIDKTLIDEQFQKLMKETESVWYSLMGLRWIAEADGLDSDAFVRTLFQFPEDDDNPDGGSLDEEGEYFFSRAEVRKYSR